MKLKGFISKIKSDKPVKNYELEKYKELEKNGDLITRAAPEKTPIIVFIYILNKERTKYILKRLEDKYSFPKTEAKYGTKNNFWFLNKEDADEFYKNNDLNEIDVKL